MKRISSFLALAFLSFSAIAQDLDIDIGKDGISVDTNEWYENPIVWVAAVLVLILIVLLSRRTAK